MTQRQKAAFSVLLGMLEKSIEDLEGAKAKADEQAQAVGQRDVALLSADLAIRLGVMQGIVGYNATELRRIFDQILETFPSVEVFGS